MLSPDKPKDEKERLASLKSLNIIHTPIEKTFERVIRVTKELFNVPIVAISFVDDEKQWFKSTLGLEIKESKREDSFCGHAILEDKVFVVEDAEKDYRFKDNPMVIGEPHIKFYAGCPIQSFSGHNVGTLCIIDKKPRSFSEEQMQYLTDMASFVNETLQIKKGCYSQLSLLDDVSEATRQSMIDPLTQIWDREAIEKMLHKKIIINRAHNQPFGIGLLDLDDFDKINDRFDKSVGDIVLKKVTDAIIDFFRADDIIGRWGGDTFFIICATNNKKELESIGNRLTDLIRNLIIKHERHIIGVSATVGLLNISVSSTTKAQDLIEQVYKTIIDGKQRGKNTFLVAEYED